MTVTTLLRLACADESRLLAEIHRECFPHYWNHEAFNDFFSVRGTQALIAEDDGESVAMLVYRVQFEQADIITLGVRPRWRRRGLGQLLVSEAIKNTAAMGANQLFLDVEDGNKAALALYDGFGFKLVNRRKLYYRQKDGSFTDALVMTRKIGL